MKQIKITLLTIAMLLCSISANAHDFVVDGIYYNILSDIEQTVEVTWYNSKSGSWPTIGSYSDEVIDIPSKVSYKGTDYCVKRIGEYAFHYCKQTLSITIPDGVSSIGANAFSGCWGLTSVIIPHSVTEIGMYAFDNCHKLLAIEIPQGLKIIDRNVFNACKSLTYVAIPTSVVEIGDWAFANCESLTSITIPEGVTSIGERAFSFCI